MLKSILIIAFLLLVTIACSEVGGRFVASQSKEEHVIAKETLDQFIEKLHYKKLNKFDKEIPAFDNAHEVVAVIDEMERFIRESSVDDLEADRRVQKAYVDALKVIFTGRGRSDDGAGWFLGNSRGADGASEFQNLLRRGKLGREALDKLEQFMTDYDFDSQGNRISHGFPPQADFYSEGKNVVPSLNSLVKNQTPSSLEYRDVLSKRGEMKSVDELLMESRVQNVRDMEITKLLVSVENNLYDESVAINNLPDKEFVNYFGRARELNQTIEALSRSERSHVLLTGKAGVGKTTILKMLSDQAVQGKLILGEKGKPPVILELGITDVTNDMDPTVIKERIAGAKELSKALDRHVILYVDEAHVASKMTRNAIKSFLTEKVTGDSKVHFVFSTTSQESREFLSDSAFSRRFTEVNVREFTKEESIEAVKKAYLRLWEREHRIGRDGFKGVADDVWEFAAKHGHIEQPHAGNPTGMKELLEGAIVHKLRVLEEADDLDDFVLELDDMRSYLKSRHEMELIPGDADFDLKFRDLWNKFEEKYVGNEGFKAGIRDELYSFFAAGEDLQKMKSWIFFGAPGGGKSYGAEQIAETFFKGSVLTVNGADYKEGGLSLNKLIGSPTGTVGSEEQRSILTQFFKDNPHGGIIKIEEADYLHPDVLQLFTNMITEKKTTDGLGKEWNTGKYIIVMNSNIGQDLMIPSNSKNKMNWSQYATRRAMLTESKVIDGKSTEVVRADLMDNVFDQFVEEIVTKGNPNGDTSAVAQEAQKQKRRYKPFYIISPDKTELEDSAKLKIRRKFADIEISHGVTFRMSDEDLLKLVDIDKYQFEKGHSYIEEQLEDKLFKYIPEFYSKRGETIDLSFELKGRTRILTASSPSVNKTFDLGEVIRASDNQWAKNVNMRERIRRFATTMTQYVKGNIEQIQETKQLLKLKMVDWNTPVVLTQIGTSGNGKTEYFKAMAKTLFDSEEAMFKLSGLNHPYDLANFFRPPTGVKGANKETDFERWFKARRNAGGGIILLDELLSFHGLQKGQMENKIAVLNELYDLLDEGKLSIGGKIYDARGFVIGITGNAMQDLFAAIPNDPSSEKLVSRILARTDRDRMVKYFSDLGIDPPKFARLGKVFLNGPLPQEETMQIGKMMLAKNTSDITRVFGRNIDVEVSDDIVDGITRRLSTIELGMREVNQGIRDLVSTSIGGILADIPEADRIEAKLDDDKILWYVNGEEVIYEGRKISGSRVEEREWTFVKNMLSDSEVRTPQFSDLKIQQVMEQSDEAALHTIIHEVKGHWMAGVLLDKKNPAEAISIIPGSGYLGYVRPKTPEVVETMSLKTILKEIIVLEAGHRALFADGVYATGGGSGGYRNKGHEVTDDLGKIDRQLQIILSNQLIEGHADFSDAKDIANFKEMMRELSKEMTDRVIKIGSESEQFDPLIRHLMQFKFADDDFLDDYVTKLDWSKVTKSGDDLLSDVLSESVEALFKKEGLSDKLKNVLGDLKSKVGKEAGVSTSDLMSKYGVKPQKGSAQIPPSKPKISGEQCHASISIFF